MDGGAWQAIVHGVAKSWTRLSHFPRLHFMYPLIPNLPLYSPPPFGNHKWFILYVYESYFCFVNEYISIIF